MIQKTTELSCSIRTTWLSTEEIALTYKYRRRVELFFKWIKQHLHVKEFYGTTENAVKIQLYCAIITGQS